MQILIHGTLAYDRIMDFPGYFKDHILADKIHELSVSFYIEQASELRGGSAGNIAYSMRMLDECPIVIASVGKDSDPYLAYFREQRLPTDNISIYPNVLTATANIITDRANNQITAFCVNAAAFPAQADLTEFNSTQTTVMLAPANNKADTFRFLSEAQKNGIRYIFDPGQTIPDFTGDELLEAISGSYAFMTNDYELEMVKKRAKVTDADILERTKVLVTTYGDRGSVIRQRTQSDIHIPAFLQQNLKDPTGAGDAYRAGFLKGLALKLPLDECGRLAACTASFAIEHVGTQQHHFTLNEFRDRYLRFFGTSCSI